MLSGIGSGLYSAEALQFIGGIREGQTSALAAKGAGDLHLPGLLWKQE
jgi:hypothetical protein